MSIDKHCILITGVGHSGTRLVVQMFAQHPDVSVPLSILNSVQEYEPLHQFFIRSMDLTPLSAEEYAIDDKELAFILDSYMLRIDDGKDYFVVKMPYYPLNCLRAFVNYFDGNISLVYVHRPKDKIVASYLRRKEDRYLFDSVEQLRQIKKLGLESRKRYLVSKDVAGFFEELVDYTEQKRRKWDLDNPEYAFKVIDIEQLSTSKQYLRETLQDLGISADYADEMLSVVNKGRLLKGRKRIKLCKLLRQVVPPFIWSRAARFRDKFWARLK